MGLRPILIIVATIIFCISVNGAQNFNATQSAISGNVQYDMLFASWVILLLFLFAFVPIIYQVRKSQFQFPGIVRITMALTLCLIVGIALVFLFVFPNNDNASLVRDILLALTGTISSIIGFYFGGKVGSDQV